MGNLPFDVKVTFSIRKFSFLFPSLMLSYVKLVYGCFIHLHFQDEELYQLFCGIENVGSSVEAVRVIRDPNVNIGKGFAYVFFKTKVRSAFLILMFIHLERSVSSLVFSHFLHFLLNDEKTLFTVLLVQLV